MTETADDWLRRLASYFDKRGAVLWKESSAGTSSQIQCFALPDDVALFARNNFKGRLRERRRNGGFDWFLSGQDADSLAEALLPHLKLPEALTLLRTFIESREAMHIYREAAESRKITPAEKSWRRELEATFKQLKQELRQARGLPLNRRRAEMRPED